MGTRSIVTFRGDWRGDEICAIYRQYDGYPEGRGKELAEFLDGYTITNGIFNGPPEFAGAKYANGMDELAILWAMHEKSKYPKGNVYLEPAGFRTNDLEYIYEVSRGENDIPQVKVFDLNEDKVYDSIESAIEATAKEQ